MTGDDLPCNRQVNLVIKNLLVEIERLPRWPSVSADPTIVPRLLVISNLLQYEVV